MENMYNFLYLKKEMTLVSISNYEKFKLTYCVIFKIQLDLLLTKNRYTGNVYSFPYLPEKDIPVKCMQISLK